jgi:hypothetical protein
LFCLLLYYKLSQSFDPTHPSTTLRVKKAFMPSEDEALTRID